jgi:hypothetical protein
MTMKTALALLFVSGLAFASSNVPWIQPDACPSGGPPALVASGPSADGAVCVGQSVRDSGNRVWQFRLVSDNSWGLFQTSPSPAQDIAFIRTGKARMSAGRIEFTLATAPVTWDYWSFKMHRAWPVGTPEPPPPVSPPPCTPGVNCGG